MTMLREASAQLATRPDEEHYPDLPAMLTAARDQRDRCREVRRDDRSILYVADGPRLLVDMGAGEVATLGHYGARQVGTLTSVPATLQDRLTARTLAQVLNETMPRECNGPEARRWLLEDAEPGQEPRVRCVTGHGYSRLWDATILADVERWAVGSGWVPALPEINSDDKGTNIRGNTKPALFRSDRDSFAFFMGPREEDGGAFGGLRPGLMVWNSEVGHKSFGFRRFYFRGMCANFLIWDASEIKTRRARHTKGVQRVAGLFSRELRRIAQPMSTAELDAFAKAAAVPFVAWQGSEKETRKAAAARLYRVTGSKVAQGQARAAIDAACDEERNASPDAGGAFLSAWDVSNGLTWVAKRGAYQEDRARLQEAAGDVLTLAVSGSIR